MSKPVAPGVVCKCDDPSAWCPAHGRPPMPKASRIVEVPASGNLPRGVVKEFVKHEFFIVTSGGIYGHYGKGATLEAARRAWRKAGGRKAEGRYVETRFTSHLPFAPMDRPALETEADAWVGQDGSYNWVRCEKEKLN